MPNVNWPQTSSRRQLRHLWDLRRIQPSRTRGLYQKKRQKQSRSTPLRSTTTLLIHCLVVQNRIAKVCIEGGCMKGNQKDSTAMVNALTKAVICDHRICWRRSMIQVGIRVRGRGTINKYWTVWPLYGPRLPDVRWFVILSWKER